MGARGGNRERSTEKDGARRAAPMKERRSILGHMSARARPCGDGRTALLELSGRVTFGDGDELVKKSVAELQERGFRHVVLDLSAVEYMDSSGVDAVVRSYNKLAEKGGKLRLIVTSERIRNLFEITKLLTVIETFDSEPEALADF